MDDLDLVTTDDLVAALRRRFPQALIVAGIRERSDAQTDRAIYQSGCVFACYGLVSEVRSKAWKRLVSSGTDTDSV